MSQNNVQLQNGNGPLAGLRNSIINGGMDVWQRGQLITPLDSSLPTLGCVITNSQLYGCDRWSSRNPNNSGGQVQHLRLNGAQGKKLGLVTDSTTSYQFIQQIIEVQNCIYLSGEVCTFSWYSSRSTSRVRLSTYDATGTRVTEVPVTQVPTSLGDSRYSVTFTMGQINSSPDQENSQGVQIILYPDGENVLNGRTDFWGTQLELGPVATPLEKRTYGLELELCQRYFAAVGGNLVACRYTTGNNYIFQQLFTTTMRAAPTISLPSPGGTTNWNSISSSATTKEFSFSGTSNAESSTTFVTDPSFDAEL